jgi:hypothetical protein
MANMSYIWKQYADLIIEPDVNGYGFDDFQRASSLIKIGEAAGREMLPTFRAWAADRELYNRFQEGSTATKIAVAPSVLREPIPQG